MRTGEAVYDPAFYIGSMLVIPYTGLGAFWNSGGDTFTSAGSFCSFRVVRRDEWLSGKSRW